MALIEQSLVDIGDMPKLDLGNPYERTPDQLKHLLLNLAENSNGVYIDKSSNPEIGEAAVYVVNGNDPHSDLGRSLEGTVFMDEWGLPQEVTQEDFAPFEGNSTFLLLVDQSDVKDPKLAGALRLVDCMTGPSETEGSFREFFGDEIEYPIELQQQKTGEGLWDIATVSAPPEYRGGELSAWLYHGLYRYSLEQGVNKWISNINPKEIRNLKEYIGIPFERVAGLGNGVYESPYNGKKTNFGFYHIEVSDIFDEVSNLIIKREADESDLRELSKLLAGVARIALLGHSQTA